MLNATVPAAATGLPALVSVRQAAALFVALQSVEETLYSHSTRDDFFGSQIDGEFNAAGAILDDLRSAVSDLAGVALEKVRAGKPADHHEEWRRKVLLAQYEVENDPGLLRAVLALMRERRPGSV